MKKCTRHKFTFREWIDFNPESPYKSKKQLECSKCSKLHVEYSSCYDPDFVAKLKQVTCEDCKFIHNPENVTCVAELADRLRFLTSRLDSAKFEL